MGLTTALYTGLSGVNANSHLINITGNNIANVNTTAYKASRADFQTEISNTLTRGSGPSATQGGTNSIQIGLGSRPSSITRNYTGGSIQPTGVATELAIEGDGFFEVKNNGEIRFTRSGAFKLDRDFNLVNGQGARVQGYGIDADYNIISGTRGDMRIPLGNLSLTQMTSWVNFSGNLNSSGPVAANGSVITSNVFYSDAAGTIPAVATDSLTSLYKAGSGTPVFATGDVITVSGALKGTATLPPRTFEVGATNTTNSNTNGTDLQSFMDFIGGSLGIDTSVPLTTAGVTAVGGAIRVEGNTGEVNDLTLDGVNIIVNAASTPSLPVSFTKSQDADGESVRTTFVAYDSLGTPMTLDLSVVLESRSNAGTVWRFYAQSADDSDVSRAVGTGTMSFNNTGVITGSSGNVISIDRDNTGAVTPQQITLNLEDSTGNISAQTDANSNIAAISQDGTARGVLTDFSVAADGSVVGIFSNSQTRHLGQVVLANFSNPTGLMEVGSNLYASTAASGNAQVGMAGENGTGSLIGGALEGSNVDLSQEFINLITATTGFSANSRVLTTSDRLIQELLSTIR